MDTHTIASFSRVFTSIIIPSKELLKAFFALVLLLFIGYRKIGFGHGLLGVQTEAPIRCIMQRFMQSASSKPPEVRHVWVLETKSAWPAA